MSLIILRAMPDSAIQNAPAASIISPASESLVARADGGSDGLTASAPATALRVVSVSLGSSQRDHAAQTNFAGRAFSIERRGTDGDFKRAQELIAELDGQVAAIGLGGIDLYLVAGPRRYLLRDAAKLARASQRTPVVDGSGLKDTLERAVLRRLETEGRIAWRGTKVLLVCAADRFGMAEELVRNGADVTFGDWAFILGLPFKMRSLGALRRLGSVILPVAAKLPFQWLYPTGAKQSVIKPAPVTRKFFEDAEIIAGDFHLIRRNLPARLDGKTILTNTVTASDVELLRERGVKRLITTTPEFGGRSFGTNVMEGVFAALGAKTPREYGALLQQLDWKPRVVELNEDASQGSTAA